MKLFNPRKSMTMLLHSVAIKNMYHHLYHIMTAKHKIITFIRNTTDLFSGTFYDGPGTSAKCYCFKEKL